MPELYRCDALQLATRTPRGMMKVFLREHTFLCFLSEPSSMLRLNAGWKRLHNPPLGRDICSLFLNPILGHSDTPSQGTPGFSVKRAKRGTCRWPPR